jgi:hypothetical protein
MPLILVCQPGPDPEIRQYVRIDAQLHSLLRLMRPPALVLNCATSGGKIPTPALPARLVSSTPDFVVQFRIEFGLAAMAMASVSFFVRCIPHTLPSS